MTVDEKNILQQYFEERLVYYDNEVSYWQDQLRLNPLSSTAQSYARALVYLGAFTEIRSHILELLHM